jgi:hypothetical protein
MTWAGDRLLYSSTANGYSSIMALVPGRTSPEEIIPHATYPSATSDGKTIVYQSTADGPRTGLWRSDGDGRNRKRILTGSVTNAVVLRDDRSVIFGSMENGMNSPWIASLDGNNKKEIVHLPVAGIRVSPDGDQLLINVAADGPPKPIICDMPDCSSQRPARFGRRWIPDGIAYIEDGDIWVQPVDQHLPPRVLARFSVADLGIVDFALSRDGKRLAVARASGTAAFVLFKGLQTPTSRLRAWLRRSLGN